MNLLRRLFGPKRTKNLVVYAVTAIVDGDVKASPFGQAPRFPSSFEDKIRREKKPVQGTIINHEIAGNSIIMLWTNDRIDAVCFIDKKMVASFPGYAPFPPEFLLHFDKALQHFPR